MNKPDKCILPAEFPGASWYDDEEISAVARVLSNQAPFRYYGVACQHETDYLEQEFARFMASNLGEPWPEKTDFYVTAVNSGTGALEVALDALEVGCGDEVLVQGFMWISSISAIIRNRAIPVVMDSDDTLNMDPQAIRGKITPKTKVLMVVPMLGEPARMGVIMEIVREINAERKAHNLPPIRVLEDCAQSIGAYARGVPGSVTPLAPEGVYRVGSFGDIGIFSLQINKNISCGEGGIIVTRSPEIHQRIEALHNVGYARNSNMSKNWYGDVPVGWGHGRRMSELQSAVARVQLKKLDQIVSRMRQSHDRLEEHIRNLGLVPRAHADPINPGHTGYYCVFRLPSISHDEMQKIEFGRRVAQVLNEFGTHPWFLHDFEIHVYYNIVPLVEKYPITASGCPWSCPKNLSHTRHNYCRGTLPHLDELLITSVGFHVPSQLSSDHEIYLKKVLTYVYESVICNKKPSRGSE